MKKTKLLFEILRVPIDFISTFSAFILAYKIRPFTDLIPGVHYNFFPELLPPFDEYIKFSLIATVFLIVLFVFNNMYSTKSVERFSKTFIRITFMVSSWLMFIIAYYFLVIHQLFFSRIALAHIWLFSIAFVTFGRIFILLIQEFLYRFDIGRIKVLFIGINSFADQSYKVLNLDKKYKVIGALAEHHVSRKIGDLKIVGTIDQLESIVKKYQVDEIIQAEPNLKNVTPGDMLAFCRSHHVHYYFIPEVLRLQSVNVEMEMIDTVPLISMKQTRLEGWGHVYKRVFDFLFSFILIQLLIPVWLIVSILIKLDSRGSIIYKSNRKYKDKIFNVYKFRSMVINADAKKANLLSQNERSGPLFKIKDDPRVTKLGRFLRKTSIDELPQLFNVLIGNMSLVGPRPHLPEEVDQYKTHHFGVFAIKPGITGLAQIYGRSNLDFEEEVKLDFYYIENWSMWLDFKIILKSAAIIFKADGH